MHPILVSGASDFGGRMFVTPTRKEPTKKFSKYPIRSIPVNNISQGYSNS